ncbi:hypothetical protein [Croceiramulus getboli]|nr:hypothetical protein P8624_03200 [Flavobacteriaceae bacterium YJPT1-3]
MKQFKKFAVLGILFILPIVAYLFFASGVNNFAKLPVLSEQIAALPGTKALPIPPLSSVQVLDSAALNDRITILGFLGNKVDQNSGYAFNLNQKIYKYFFEFKDFQFVSVLPLGQEEEALRLREELGAITDMSKWRFIFAEPEEIENFFNSLQTDVALDQDLSTPYVFIIDKDGNLRGRSQDDDGETLYGYDTSSVAVLGDKMKDDVKIILAEYRLALKKNTADRKK